MEKLFQEDQPIGGAGMETGLALSLSDGVNVEPPAVPAGQQVKVQLNKIANDHTTGEAQKGFPNHPTCL